MWILVIWSCLSNRCSGCVTGPPPDVEGPGGQPQRGQAQQGGHTTHRTVPRVQGHAPRLARVQVDAQVPLNVPAQRAQNCLLQHCQHLLIVCLHSA